MYKAKYNDVILVLNNVYEQVFEELDDGYALSLMDRTIYLSRLSGKYGPRCSEQRADGDAHDFSRHLGPDSGYSGCCHERREE